MQVYKSDKSRGAVYVEEENRIPALLNFPKGFSDIMSSLKINKDLFGHKF